MSDVNDSDLLVLPRAEVEALIAEWRGEPRKLRETAYVEGARDAYDRSADQLDALLAAAPQVVDAGVQRAMRDSGAQSGESEYYVDADCPDDGTYRVLLIRILRARRSPPRPCQGVGGGVARSVR